MQKKIILLFFLFVNSCTRLPSGQGEYNEVIILCSPEDRINIEPIITDFFDKSIYTPQLEKEIKINWKKPWEIDKNKYKHNIILASLDFPSDSTGDRLVEKFIQKQNIDKELFIVSDLFAKNQKIVSVKALDAIHFNHILNTNSSWIKDEVRNNISDILWEDITSKKNNEYLESKIQNKFSIKMFIQEDFQIIKNDENFLWIGRGYPYRWLTFGRYTNRFDNISSKEFWYQLEYFFKNHIPEIKLVDALRFEEKLVINENNFLIARGLYDHSESSTGGPFVIYIFEGIIENELILVSGFINNPGFEKMFLLKQLEVMIQKIKYK